MLILVLISLITLLLTHLEREGVVKKGMLIGFVILTIVLGIRFEYGNDYVSYYQKFYSYGDEFFRFSDLKDGIISDPLWYILNRLFYPLGFESMIMFLTIVSSYTYYKLIRLLPSDLWVFGVFIYLFTSSFMPIQLSMLRQSLAMCLVILATISILENKVVPPIFFLIVASGIHSSSLLCAPFLLLLYIDYSKHKKIVVFGFLGLLVLYFAAKNLLMEISGSILNSMGAIDSLAKYDEKYFLGGEYVVSESKSLFGFLLYLFPVSVSLRYVMRSRDVRMVKLSVLYLLGSFIFLLDQMIPMVGRLAWYFTIFSIVSLPVAFKSINNKTIRWGLIAIFIAITLREYTDFFYAVNWRDSYMYFKTILSH